MTMPGRISSPSSSPSRSMSNALSPIPQAVWVGFSRSWAATAWAKRSRFFAILSVAIACEGYPPPRGLCRQRCLQLVVVAQAVEAHADAALGRPERDAGPAGGLVPPPSAPLGGQGRPPPAPRGGAPGGSPPP